MIEVYMCNISAIDYNMVQILKYIYENVLSKEIRKHINDFRFSIDKKRSCVGVFLLWYALYKKYKQFPEKIEFVYNKYGKPFLSNSTNLYFNISHSGDWVVCAVSDYVIGIDVEEIQREFRIDVANRIMSIEEVDICRRIKEKEKYFYQIWTLKESFSKACGKGLAMKFADISLGDISKKINVRYSGYTENKFKFILFEIDEAYYVSICTME